MSDEIEATDAGAVCHRCGSYLYSDGVCPDCSVEDFTSERAEDSAPSHEAPSSEARQTRHYSTCLFTDLVDSTALKQRLGDLAGARLIARHNEIFRSLLRDHGGREQINPGDGFFATFERPSDAVRFALAFRERLSGLEGPETLAVRIGIHVGGFHVVSGHGTAPPAVLGLAVDIAARVMGLALPQQILMTRNVFDEARQVERRQAEDVALRWIAHGAYWLKGVEEPVDVCEVGREGDSPLRAPVDSSKARRQMVGDREDAPGWRPAAGLEVPDRPGFRLKHRLGEGGFGEVWLADKTAGRERAFKFCFRPDRVRALRREVTVFRWLRDQLGERSDIASLLDWHLDSAPYFLEATYVPGGNLVEWAAKQGGLSAIAIEKRLDIALQTARAIQAAHTVGVLHKDVKPSNILVVTEESGATRVRIIDFGLGDVIHREELEARGISVTEVSRAEPGSTGTTATGTAGYMAPEVRSGSPATTRSDVYSLGVLLYQLVVGDFDKLPAEGWDRDVAAPILREDIRSSIYGDPESRLSSASELVHRLETLGERRERMEDEQRLLEGAQHAKRKRAQQRRQMAAALLLTALIGTVFLIHRFRAARDELAQTNLTISRLVRQIFERELRTAMTLVDRGAQNAEVPLALAAMEELSGGRTRDERLTVLESPSRPRLQAELTAMLGVALRAEWVVSAAVANRKGAMVGHLVQREDELLPDDGVLAGDYSNRDWFHGRKQQGQAFNEGSPRQMIRAMHISEPYVASTSGNQPKLAISTPVLAAGASGDHLGVFQVAVAIEYLNRWIRSAARSGEDGIERDVVIVNRAGQIVLHPDPSALLKAQDPTSREAPEWKPFASFSEGVTKGVEDPFQKRRFDASVSKLDVADESFTILVRSPPSASATTWIVLAIIFGSQLIWGVYLWTSSVRVEPWSPEPERPPNLS